MNMNTDKAYMTFGQYYLRYGNSIPHISLKVRERKIPLKIYPSPFSENPYIILLIKFILSQELCADNIIIPYIIGINYITEIPQITFWANFLENNRKQINKTLRHLNSKFFDNSLIGDWDSNLGYPGLGLFSFSIKNPNNIIQGLYEIPEVIYTLVLNPRRE